MFVKTPTISLKYKIHYTIYITVNIQELARTGRWLRFRPMDQKVAGSIPESTNFLTNSSGWATNALVSLFTDLPFVFFPVETAAGHQKLSDDGCSQDAGTGVRGRSAWLLQQSIIWYQRGPPATFAECTECGSKIHHWCKKIRSHLSCVAWSSLVTSATKDNLQDRHLDAPVLERFGTSLPGDRLYLNLVDARPKTVAICNIRTAIHSKNQDNDVWTKVVQGLWSHSLEWSACQIEGFFSEQKLFQKIA